MLISKKKGNLKLLVEIVRRFSDNTEQCNLAENSRKLYQWKLPVGHDTGIQVTNSYRCLGKRNDNVKVPLVVCNPRHVTWYACGPTVYDKPHVGNASTYIKFDTIRRILTSHFGLSINLVIGITDVDDKIIQRASLLGKDFHALALYYEDEFKRTMQSLGMLHPTMYVRVSDVMSQIILFIQRLIEKGLAYRGESGSVYFNVDGFTDFGRLMYVVNEWDSETSQLLSEKRSSKDFGLWKAAKPGEPFWEAPWGKGRPGWHVECSTIASLVFGNQFDIHSGAKDLFLHHECEVYQSEAFHSKEQWVNYFLHAGYLIPEGSEAKMSKSIGNVVNADEFAKTHSADCFRMICVSADWNANLIFKPSSVKSAERRLRKIRSHLDRCRQYIIGNLNGEIRNVDVLQMLEQCKHTVHRDLCNNFNIAGAIRTLENVCEKMSLMFTSPRNKTSSSEEISLRESTSIMEAYLYITEVFKSFGFTTLTAEDNLVDLNNPEMDSNAVMKEIHDFRNSVRKIANEMKQENISYSKNLFVACDEVRQKLSKKGASLSDSKVSLL